ncbi:MAG TPA: hypothetical protein VKL61_06450, partial [Candidatus Polarisedimenticolia bacterium]|nr:hypothetical protein [Candidatus Polarisedimenticolia bacterium]
QIVAPLQNPFRGVSFSPDGNYVYYVNQETGGPGYSILYQIPVLGGSARKLIFDIDTAVTFSPDGKKLSFVRGYPQLGEEVLMVANADGTGEKKLAVRKRPDGFPTRAPSWSSDGKWIAAIASSFEGGFHFEVIKVDAGDGKYSSIGSKRWLEISSLAWVPNGSALVLTAADQIGGNHQVWSLSYPDAEARRISNDLNEYIGVSVTADSKALATTQAHHVSNLWISPASDSTAARQITFGSGDQDAIGGVAAAGADSVVFVAAEGDFRHLWRIGSDGSNRTRLTPESTHNFGLAVSRDERVIVFNSVREDGLAHIWRMDREGGNPTQITSGKGEGLAGLSPDGRWILHGVAEKRGLWKLPVTGGASVKIADDFLGDAVFSPDGKLIAYEGYIQKDGLLRRSISVIPSDGGTAIQSLPYPDGFRLHWVPEGDAFTYYREVDGVSNVWRQSLDGTPPKQITDFKSGQIFSYDWAPDGKTLILSRGQETSDIVLITNFH